MASDPTRTTHRFVPVSEQRRAVAVCDHGGAMQAVGCEPNHRRERRPGATSGKGSRGAQHPLASPDVYTSGRLAHDM